MKVEGKDEEDELKENEKEEVVEVEEGRIMGTRRM